VIEVSVKSDVDRAIAELELLEKDVRRAASMALNRVAEVAKGTASRDISARARLPLGKVRKRISIRKSSMATGLVAEVNGRAYSPNLANYSPTQDKQGTGANVLGRYEYRRHAFILSKGKRSKGRPVMIRQGTGTARVPRKPLESIRVEVLKKEFVGPITSNAMRAAIDARWQTEFDSAIRAVSTRAR
jgi:hypothetical protein